MGEHCKLLKQTFDTEKKIVIENASLGWLRTQHGSAPNSTGHEIVPVLTEEFRALL